MAFINKLRYKLTSGHKKVELIGKNELGHRNNELELIFQERICQLLTPPSLSHERICQPSTKFHFYKCRLEILGASKKLFFKTAKFFLRKLLQFCSARCLAIDREKGEERGWVRERETEWECEREKESTTEREGERGEEIEWEREKPFKQNILCLAFWWKGAGVSKRHLQKMFCFFFFCKISRMWVGWVFVRCSDARVSLRIEKISFSSGY